MRTIAALAFATFALPTVVAATTGCSAPTDTPTRGAAPGAPPAVAPGAGAATAGGAPGAAQGGTGGAGGPAAPGGPPAGAPAGGDPLPAAPVLPVGAACPASLIYALGQSGTKGSPGLPVTLFSFDPANRIFQAIGSVSCLSQVLALGDPADCAGGACLSMAVARDGTLTVFSTPLGGGAQTIQHIQSSDATCLDSSALPILGSVVEGSQFVTDGAGGESLIVSVADRTSPGAPEFLGHLVPNAPAIVDLRSLTGPFAEDAPATRMMTTNGQGHLLFERSGNLLEVDPATANVVGIRTGLSTFTGAQETTASAFWGGSLYYFGAALPGGPTAVTRLDLATGTADLALPDTGAYVLAATSGYCAPRVAP